MNKKLFLTLIALTLSAAQSFSQQTKVDSRTRAALDKVNQEKIRSHIAYLADDKLKGRKPGTEGYRMAVDYVVNQFKEIGLSPAGDNSTFTQALVIRQASTDLASALAVLRDKSGNAYAMSVNSDIFLIPDVLKSEVNVEAALVFAGYGIDIPGTYSDYNDIDVKGKFVVVLSGSPKHLALNSTLAAHFGSSGSKSEVASLKGAAGIMIVSLTPPPRTPTSTATVSMNPDRTIAYGRSAVTGLQAVTLAPYNTLQRLFFNSDKSLNQTVEELEKGSIKPLPLNITIKLNYKASFKDIETQNVVGKVTGSDKKLKEEYVIHTAHLDHVGIGVPVKGDSIYNGAHDNASGVASLIEIGRVYQQSARPKRSVLIVMVTAEEMGLLGSAYFAGNPTVPKSQIVANVNTDMPTVIAPLLSIVPLGAEHSSLVNHVDFACQQLGIARQQDPMPEENRFVRSDQYSFVLQGIPALHIKYGSLTKDNAFDLVEFTKKWRDANYHLPSDHLNDTFDFEAARKYVQLNFLISFSVANTIPRPTWNQGDFFGKRTGGSK